MTRVYRHFPLGIVTAATALAACSGDAGSDPSGEHAIGASDEGRPWAAEPSVEGVLEAASGDDVFLSSVLDIAVDSRGRTYVVDFEEDGIIVLSPDLTLDRTIGREGEGPGEFLYVSQVQLLPDDKSHGMGCSAAAEYRVCSRK